MQQIAFKFNSGLTRVLLFMHIITHKQELGLEVVNISEEENHTAPTKQTNVYAIPWCLQLGTLTIFWLLTLSSHAKCKACLKWGFSCSLLNFTAGRLTDSTHAIGNTRDKASHGHRYQSTHSCTGYWLRLEATQWKTSDKTPFPANLSQAL